MENMYKFNKDELFVLMAGTDYVAENGNYNDETREVARNLHDAFVGVLGRICKAVSCHSLRTIKDNEH